MKILFRGEWIQPEAEIRYGQHVPRGAAKMADQHQQQQQEDNILNETQQYIQKMDEVEKFRQTILFFVKSLTKVVA